MTSAPTLRGRAAAVRLARSLRAWPAARSGLAAVEFALILPVMVTLWLGMTEVTSAVNVDRKLTLLSRSLADLSARVPKISTSDMSSIFSAASAVLQPYDASNAQMVISSIKVTQTGSTYSGSVLWSCAKNIPTKPAGAPTGWGAGYLKPRTVGSAYTVPNGFQMSKSFMLIETLIPYKPLFGYIITGTINLTETTPWPVRNVDYVDLTGGCPA